MDDPADHPTVINTLDTPLLVRKKSLEALKLGDRQPKMMGLHQKSSKRIRGLLNHTRSISGTCLWVLTLAIHQPSAFFPMNNLASNRINKSRTISMNIAQHISPIKMTIKNIPFLSYSQLSLSQLNKTL
jgi:hypothetical protein